MIIFRKKMFGRFRRGAAPTFAVAIISCPDEYSNKIRPIKRWGKKWKIIPKTIH